MFPTPDEWKTVAREPLETFAVIKRDLLIQAGIPAVLRGNKASGTAGAINELNVSWDNPLGGVEVRVHRDDALLAREILESFEGNRACNEEGFDIKTASGELGMEKWARFARSGARIMVIFWVVASLVWLFLAMAGRP